MSGNLNRYSHLQIKIFSFVFLLFLSPVYLFGQNSTYNFDPFKFRFEGTTLKVWDKQNKEIYQRSFINPYDDIVDLDGDGVDEYLVTDSRIEKGFTYYSLYIFNTIDSFYVADSINSGLLEPYTVYSKEIKGIMIVSGNPKFNSFNKDTVNIFLPVECRKYDDGHLFDINDELYDFFISQNDNLIDYIDSYLENNPKDCNTSVTLNAVLVSAYVNYLNAGEKILANQLLKKYYFCKDIELFKQKINALIKRE